MNVDLVARLHARSVNEIAADLCGIELGRLVGGLTVPEPGVMSAQVPDVVDVPQPGREKRAAADSDVPRDRDLILLVQQREEPTECAEVEELDGDPYRQVASM